MLCKNQNLIAKQHPYYRREIPASNLECDGKFKLKDPPFSSLKRCFQLPVLSIKSHWHSYSNFPSLNEKIGKTEENKRNTSFFCTTHGISSMRWDNKSFIWKHLRRSLNSFSSMEKWSCQIVHDGILKEAKIYFIV